MAAVRFGIFPDGLLTTYNYHNYSNYHITGGRVGAVLALRCHESIEYRRSDDR